MVYEFDQFLSIEEEINIFTQSVNKNLALKLASTQEISRDFTQRIRSLNREEKELNDKLSQLSLHKNTISEELSTAQNINDEVKKQIQDYESKKKSLQVQEDVLSRDLKRATTMLQKEMEKQSRLKQRVSRRKERKIEKVAMYEQLLGLTIESNKWGNDSDNDQPIDKDAPPQVTFTFSKFDEKDMNKKCSIVLETSIDETAEEPFKIVTSTPELKNKDYYSSLIDTLKQPDGLRNFIIQSRKLLIQTFQKDE
ncbi:kinetochore protein Spc25p [Monosporozyma servazzii]